MRETQAITNLAAYGYLTQRQNLTAQSLLRSANVVSGEPAFRLGEAISASPLQNVDGWAGRLIGR